MHRIKRTLVWLMVAVLLGSSLPASFFKQADAATAATYFIPDLKALRDTAFVDPGAAPASTDPLPLVRDNVYQTSSGQLTITGTYAYVASNSMAVKVEQLSVDETGRWVTDSTHVTTSTVTADTGSTNRFSASNLPLFSGFNKITFTGLQGSVNRSDIFYVLYDSVPYMKSLKVNGGTGGSINLNEGTQVVLDSSNVTMQGVVQNATKVTMSLNGGSPTITSLLDDGTFFTPAVTLNAGINTVSLTISNASDSRTYNRILYFYDKDHPFTKLNYIVGPSASPVSYSLLNGNVPIVSTNATNVGNVSKLEVQLLVPYDSVPFAGNGQYSLNGSGTYTTVTATTSPDVVITGYDGVTPVYRLVSFEIPYTVDTLTVDQTANVAIKYGTSSPFLAGQSGKFKYLPNDVVINNMYYLPDFAPNALSPVDVAEANKIPLSGSEVTKSDFYILVETDKAPTTSLTGTYIPGNTTLNLTQVTAGVTTGTNQYVYKVSGFANGQQTVNFQYQLSTASKSANITYASQSYIYISNLYDGQTYTFNSKLTTNSLTVSGQFIGFKGWTTSTTPPTATNDNIQMFVNGTVQKDSGGVEIKPVLTPVSDRDDAYSFSINLKITEAGPLIYGQNRIRFTGTITDASGNVQLVSKEIRINIVDENISTITKFYPVLIPIDGREPFTDFVFDGTNYPDDKLARIFTTSPEFTFANDKYTTSKQSYDLVMRGSGAKHVNLYYGSDLFGHIDLSTITANNGSFTFNGVNYPYHIALSSDGSEFILRVEGITFEQPGSMIFNLELINETGARSTQKLEVVREVASYRLLAPQPTVGDQIVVNKNFVRFDIEAEGATQVLVGKNNQATKRSDYEDRFFYDYVGLTPNKDNKINIQVIRDGSTFNDTVHVYYTDSVQVDSQYMEPLKSKHTVFNKELQLSFPKGTVLKSSDSTATAVTKFYNNQQLLFAISDDSGIVERKNDYGNVIGNLDDRSEKGQYQIYVPDYLVSNFQSTANTSNFSRVSEIYWISGGVGENGDKGTTGYQPAMNGITPYAINPYASSGDRTLKYTEIPSNRKIVPSNRGSLTLAFDPNIVDAAETSITVFRYTDTGKWTNVGGEVNIKSHTITVPFDDFGYYTVMKMRKGFSDVTNHSWARNILNALYSKGIMNPTLPPNVFGADDETTRGEFATLIVKGMSLPINSDDTQSFYDVLPGVSTATWSYDYIETAARAGIVNGITEGFFNPEGKLTREEAAVMIARALKLKLATNDSKLESALAKSFLDSSSVQYYARPAVQAVSKAKVMSGSPVDVQGKTQFNFNPKGKLTRAEAGKIAVALFQKNTKLFPSNLS